MGPQNGHLGMNAFSTSFHFICWVWVTLGLLVESIPAFSKSLVSRYLDLESRAMFYFLAFNSGNASTL